MDQSAPHIEQILSTIADVIQLTADSPEPLPTQLIPAAGENFTIRVKATEQQMGRLIGSAGRTARSIRTLLTAMTAPLKIRVGLDIEASD